MWHQPEWASFGRNIELEKSTRREGGWVGSLARDLYSEDCYLREFTGFGTWPSPIRSTDSRRLPPNNSCHLGGQKPHQQFIYLFITRAFPLPSSCPYRAGDYMWEGRNWGQIIGATRLGRGPGPEHVVNQYKIPVKVFSCLPLLGTSNLFSSLRLKLSLGSPAYMIILHS